MIRDYRRNKSLLVNKPHLLDIQLKSFDEFVRKGLREVFASQFPVEDHRGRFVLEFLDLSVGDPVMDEYEARRKAVTYAFPVTGRFRIIKKTTGEVKEQDIYIGELPAMTSRGTFIIGGTERVIVNQLVRSPGVYFSTRTDERGQILAEAMLIPNRGAWMRFETSSDSEIFVRLDRSTRRMPVTMLLKAIGAGDGTALRELFGGHPMIEQTLAADDTSTADEAILKIYSYQRPGEPPTLEGARAYLRGLLFDPSRYDLAPVGRYNLNRRLDALRRAHLRTAAEDIKDANGNVLFAAGEQIDRVGADSRPRRVVVSSGGQKIVLLDNGAPSLDQRVLTIEDLLSTISFLIGLTHGIGYDDDVDHLGNRRVRTVGELIENQCNIGVTRIVRNVRNRFGSVVDDEMPMPRQVMNTRPFTATLHEFFSTSRLSQYMDQTNTLSEVTHKRRLSALGPGGLKQETATLETRDVHHSHYGRICPIETPEGQNVGLISSLACYARINEFGFIETPYRRVDKKTGRITDQIDYLMANEEEAYVIAPFDTPTDGGIITPGEIPVRHQGKIMLFDSRMVDYIEVAPDQTIGVSASLIPFLENTDAIRAGMGANMQRQAVPLIHPQKPRVMTGNERQVAADGSAAVLAKRPGVVEDVRADRVVVRTDDGDRDIYVLRKFMRTNASSCYNQRPVVRKGQRVEAGALLADNSDTDGGYLALGANVLVAFMPWEGYNYEDAIVISERLVKDDVFTSIHIQEYTIEVRNTKLGPEIMTPEIPNVPSRRKAHLDENGIAVVGASVGPGDILVGKMTPKGERTLTNEERLIQAIFGKQMVTDMKNASLVMPHGEYGRVIGHEILSRDNGDALPSDVIYRVTVYVAQHRKISIGDKLSGRHGNKGVIARILPEADMPFLPDGRRIDIILNPLGVPSRMNIGQILEAHLGLAASKMGLWVETPVFDGATAQNVLDALAEAGYAPRQVLYDGRTGERFEEPVMVGILYMLKLHHLVDEKFHARSVGPYSMVTQQPLGGKAQFGGQRFGEMEVWALEAHGAAHTLQEMLTIKSDDIGGRVQTYEALLQGLPIPEPQRPESLLVLIRELNGLGFGIRLFDEDGKTIFLEDLSPSFTIKDGLLKVEPPSGNPDDKAADEQEVTA